MNETASRFRVRAKTLPAMADFASKVFCRIDARTYEEDTAISCGRFSLTYYSLLRIFKPSQSKFLVRQAKSEESGWLRTGLTDTESKDCGTAGKPGG